MPVSQGSAGGIPGMNLKAWAFVDASNTMTKNFNVASNVRGGVGSFVLTFTAALSSASYIVRVTAFSSGGAAIVGVSKTAATAASVTYVMKDTAGAAVDGIHLVEVYE